MNRGKERSKWQIKTERVREMIYGCGEQQREGKKEGYKRGPC